MRRAILLGTLFIFCLSVPNVSAKDEVWKKAGRGAANFATGWGEVIYQIEEMGKRERWPIAFFGGLAKGIVRGTARTLLGVFEVVTAPFPSYKPIMQPEYIFKPVFRPVSETPNWGDQDVY